MAKYKQTAKEKKAEIKYKSDFGSHTEMINEDYLEFNSGDHGFVICTDSRGDYVTHRKYLDCGLCDYNRSVDTESREDKLKLTLENK